MASKKGRALPPLALMALLILPMLLSSSTAPVTNAQSAVVVSTPLPSKSDPVGAAYDSGKGEVFVADFGLNTVSVISDRNDSVVASIPVGLYPDRVAYDSAKGEVFVTDVGSGSVSVISDSTNTVVASVAVGAYPYGVAYDSAKGEIFVANYGSNTTSVINDSDNEVIASIPSGSSPHGIAYDSAKGEVFVTNYDSDTVQVISDSSNTVVATVTVGRGPDGVAYDSAKGEIFVTNKEDNTVSVVSDSDNAVVATVPVGASPIGIAYDSGKGAVFAINEGSNTTSVISDSNNEVIETIRVGSMPYDAAYDSAKGDVFVADYGSNTVSIVSDAALSTTTLTSMLTATGPGGQQVPLAISTNNPTINITNAQITTGTLTTSGVTGESYKVSFTIAGLSGTNGTTTVTIPKVDVPSGLTPTVYIDGSPAADQSFTQDAVNYYVTFTSHFSTHTVSIEFIPSPTSSNTSTSGGGIPEFTPEVGLATLATAIVVASFVVARRARGSRTLTRRVQICEEFLLSLNMLVRLPWLGSRSPFDPKAAVMG